MGFTGFVAIGIGGALGSWLRWGLGVRLNPRFPTLPLGTLAANLAGGLLMGCMMGVWDHFHAMPPELKLFIFTGFLGGLTTFSTFSAEASTLLLRRQYFWFGSHVAAHVIGSLTMTILGLTITRNLLQH
jgi:CrcB protein